METSTTTLRKSGTGYDVLRDGEVLGNVSRQGRDRWTYTLSPEYRERVTTVRPWVSDRDLHGCLGGYSREECVESLVRSCDTLVHPLDD